MWIVDLSYPSAACQRLSTRLVLFKTSNVQTGDKRIRSMASQIQIDRAWKCTHTAFYLRCTHFQSKIINPTDTKLKTCFEKILNSNVTSLQLFLGWDVKKRRELEISLSNLFIKTPFSYLTTLSHLELAKTVRLTGLGHSLGTRLPC